jgi:hypothetical protein
MAGIDGITADILAAAREEAGKILAQAQEQAQFEPLIEEALQHLKITQITPDMEI